jgi:hypothetical protein
MYHAPIIKSYYRMDPSKASTGYELAGRMESILRAHSVEFLLDGYALLVRVSNEESLDRRRICF